MKLQPELFQGSIAQDFAGILDSEVSLEAKKRKKTPGNDTGITKGPDCSVRKPCKKKTPNDTGLTKGPDCTVNPAACKTKKKKTEAFVPHTGGWSSPPAPPAF